MTSDESVTHWLGQLKAGDPCAAQPLWARYFQQLVGLARQRLRAMPRVAADEEDVALSAFDTFCRNAQRGRFPQLDDRNDLWRLLVRLTVHKAVNLIRREQAHKCGLARRGAANEEEAEKLLGHEPSPEFAAQVAEEYQRLLRLLDTGELRSVAVWKMEGYNNEEIAAKLGCVLRTVERRLEMIRSLWKQEEKA